VQGAGALLHVAQHAAGPLRHQRGPRIGRAHQGRGHRRLAVVQPVGGLAKQRAAQRINAHQLAAKRHEVEVGLQDLVLAPAPVQHLRGHGLPQLLHHGAPARALAPVPVQQPASCMVMVLAPRVRWFHRLPQAAAEAARQSTPLCS
jgi:hypothetical protein